MRPRTTKSGEEAVFSGGSIWEPCGQLLSGTQGLKSPKCLLLIEGGIAARPAEACAGSGTVLPPAWLFLSKTKELSICPSEEPHICVLGQKLPLLEVAV